MSAKTTITESELTAIAKAARKTRPALTFEEFLRVALGKLGITVVPDPIPEPEGDVIVVDAQGFRWERTDHGRWTTVGVEAYSWERIVAHGPVKIYRLEENHV